MNIHNGTDFDAILIYKNVLQNMHDGVITIASDGTIITFNPAAAEILMFDNKNLIGEPFSKIFSKLLEDPRNDKLNDAIFSAIYESAITHHKDVKYYSGKTCKDLLISSTALIVEKNSTNQKVGMILVINDISERQRLNHVQKLFGKYIDPQIAKRLIDQPEEALTKANRQTITVSFCDMNGFTKLCETLPPAVMEQLMNAYFTKMSRAVHMNEGVIDKFIGDSIMSFWGPPFSSVDKHSINGCQTALDQIACLPQLNNEFKAMTSGEFKDSNINISIGIATGELVIVNIGSSEHKSITIMGNIVNIASRLVGANKLYGTSILVTEDVVKSTNTNYIFREIDTIRVKGKEIHTTIYELIARKENLTSAQEKFLEVYAKALQFYRQRDWVQARKGYESALSLNPNDLACKVFLDRINFFSTNPPEASWEGIWILESK